MANICKDILIRFELRPCWINGKKALFHRWIQRDKLCGIIGDKLELHGSVKLEYTRGIIEFEDGTISEVEPMEIKFDAGKVNEYMFFDDLPREDGN